MVVIISRFFAGTPFELSFAHPYPNHPANAKLSIRLPEKLIVNKFSFTKVIQLVAEPDHVHTSEFRMSVCLYVHACVICAELQVFPHHINNSKVSG